jgi:hypothetical protein
MLRKAIRMAAAVAGLAALGCTGASAATSPSWRVVKSVHSGVTGDFTAVVATGPTTAWAFNGNPVADREVPAAWARHGSTWTRVSFPGRSGEEVVAAGATSPSDVWAFTNAGSGSRVLRWDGHRWALLRTFPKPIGGAAVRTGHDVWVFGQPGIIEQLGAWHYNGHGWSQVAGHLDGGSALAANSVWAFSGTNVDHWNGRTWASTSVKRLLPPRQQLNDPGLTGIYARSAGDVYAVGNGNRQDEGGPAVILHYNGHTWRKVAEGSFGYGTLPSQQISPDGRGGLWLPMPGVLGAPSYLVHYAAGRLSTAALPAGARSVSVGSVARIPGTDQALAGGFTHARDNTLANVVAVILQYR